MEQSNCGVCNKPVSFDERQFMMIESDKTVTAYHMGCEYRLSKVKPCEDCGQHRLFCNDCGEPE